MSIFKETNTFKRKIRSFVFTLFNKIENNNNHYFNENGERNFILNVVSKLSKQLVIFDVGANIGEYTRTLVDLLDKCKVEYKIHLFEPSQVTFGTLTNYLQNLHHLIFNKVGISDVEGDNNIYYDNEQSGLSSLYKRDLKSENIEVNKSEEITLIRLDNYIENNNIEHINYLKLDIEGHELFAIKSLGKYLNDEFIDVIQFEYGGCNLDSHTTLLDFYQLLEPLNFSMFKLMRNHLERRPYNRKSDNFQYANYIAFSNKKLKEFES